MSESIQLGAIMTETPKVGEDPNQATRRDTVQLNIIKDNENVTSQPCCAPTDQPFCTRKVWVLHDIEETVRARKCPNLCLVFKWIVHLIFWIIAIIVVIGNFSLIGGLIGCFLVGIGYLFYLGTIISVLGGILGLILFLLFLIFVDSTHQCGVFEYLTNTSS